MQVEHFADKLLQTAATAVQCGHMTPEGAAKMHGVSSEMLTRMVAWQGVKEEREEEEDMVSKEPCKMTTTRSIISMQAWNKNGQGRGGGACAPGAEFSGVPNEQSEKFFQFDIRVFIVAVRVQTEDECAAYPIIA